MRVISGGQTGVDQAALYAARDAGLITGGYMPRGFRTQAGLQPELARMFGMVALTSPNYPARTLRNVRESSATLIMGDPHSRGCALTIRYCLEYGKGTLVVHREHQDAGEIVDWLMQIKPAVLNVAGNREETNPGIFNWARELLHRAFVTYKDLT